MAKLIFLVIFFMSANNTQAQTRGCTDPLATNYKPSATENDGSCEYNASTTEPVSSWELPQVLQENSGLIIWNEKVWLHNDDSDVNLYSLDVNNVNDLQAHPLRGVVNTDWEEVSQDADYLYIGDFGNNVNGNRTDLKILRIDKSSLQANEPVVDTISFSYALQTDLNPKGINKTDFDCEAFIVTADSIYLFTKEWLSKKSSIYSMPKQTGSHVAQYRSAYDVQGLITGATYLEVKNLVVLSGYNELLQPFLILLYDFSKGAFFEGNKRKVSISLPFHQVEGIATEEGLIYWVSNEAFTNPYSSTKQQLHKIDLSAYLGRYLSTLTATEKEGNVKTLQVYPVPSSNHLSVKMDAGLVGEEYSLVDMNGRVVLHGILKEKETILSIQNLVRGSYLMLIGNTRLISRRIIKE